MNRLIKENNLLTSVRPLVLWHQHLLRTTPPLIEEVNALHAEPFPKKPFNFIVGKMYSTSKESVARLSKHSDNGERLLFKDYL